MSRTKQKPSDQQRRHTEIIAKLKEWIAARTPLQIASEGYGIFSIRPLKGDSGDDVMTMRTRQGLVSITGLSPRLRQEGLLSGNLDGQKAAAMRGRVPTHKDESAS